MLLFTDFILDEDTKFAIGFVMVSFIGLFLVFNLALVLFFGAKDLMLLFKKYSKRFKHKFFPQPEEESESESEEE